MSHTQLLRIAGCCSLFFVCATAEEVVTVRRGNTAVDLSMDAFAMLYHYCHIGSSQMGLEDTALSYELKCKGVTSSS